MTALPKKIEITLYTLFAVACVSFVIWIYVSPSKSRVELVEAKLGTITQTVSVTGNAKSMQSVSLAFEKSGRVSAVYALSGDKVTIGQPLVALEQADLFANLNQAKGGLDAASAKLNEIIKGARPEDIQITEAELQKVNQDLSNTYDNILDLINNSYTESENAVRIKTADMFSGTKDTFFSFTLNSSCDSNNAESLRLTSDKELDSWKKELNLIFGTLDTKTLDQAMVGAKNHIEVFKKFLDALNIALYSCSMSTSASTLNTYRASTNIAQSNILTTLTKIKNQEQTISTQKALIEQVKKTLSFKKAGSSPEQIDAQKAVVKQAEASAQASQAQLEKATLRAPFSGVVTIQDAKIGEIVSPNIPLVSLISQLTLEIEANIPEVDSGKVKIGNPVTIDFDALPAQEFKGIISFIDPAETVIDGVVNFKIKINFEDSTRVVKSGFTANLKIKTLKKDNVIVLPQFAIVENDSGTFVRVQGGGSTKDIPIQVGIRGEDGSAEIISGVKVGEKVINVAKASE